MMSSGISTPTLRDHCHAILLTAQVLVYGKPEYPWSTSLLLWTIRVLTFSILLRTFFGPWFLRLVYSRIRIRSISLRSVRGVFFRQGDRTWRVERISYIWGGRITIKVEGFSLEIGNSARSQPIGPRKAPVASKYAFPSPKPIFRQVRLLYDVILTQFEPLIRPVARKYAVACLRIAIRWLPTLTRALSFEIRQVSITFAALPGTKITVDEINLSASVEFQETEQEVEPPQADLTSNVESGLRTQGMAIWSNRLRDGFRRSLDRAWGSTKGKANLALKIYNVRGNMPPQLQGSEVSTTFLSLLQPVELSAGMDFNPRVGTIEPHTLDVTLNVGHIAAKADVLVTLLAKLTPTPATATVSGKRDLVVPPLNLESPRSSFFFPSPRLSSTFQSAIPSFTSSIFSPGLSAAPASSFSSKTANPGSPTTLKSPASPLFKAISASMMRPRRHQYLRRSTKLKDETSISSLSVLKSIKIGVGVVRLSASASSPLRTYSASLKGLDIVLGLAHASNTQFHKKWLGNRLPSENYDPDTYSLEISLGRVKAEKDVQLGAFPLLLVGPVAFNAVAHQWPAPFLVASPFIRGDPNSPFVGFSFRIASVEATQKLQELRELIDSLPNLKGPAKNVPSPPPPPSPLALPRVVCEVECGPIAARLLFTTNSGQELRALVARTNGIVLSIQSSYRHAPPSIIRVYPASTSVLPVQMQGVVSVYIDPLSVKTCSISHGAIEGAEPDDPSVFSAGSIEFTSKMDAIAETDGPGESIAVIDKSSISCDNHIVIDSLCIELWQPMVVDSVHQFLSLIPPTLPTPELDPNSPSLPLRKPPFGILFSASLAQCVAFVTAPDINPNDTYELSRGLSFRTAVGFEACSIHPNHGHWYDDELGLERRSKLLLPPNLVVQSAVAAGKAASSPHGGPLLIKVQLYHSAVRSLAATQFAPSEPVISERLDVPQLPQDFLRVKHIQLDASISPTSTDHNLNTLDTCSISVEIPSMRADFKLSHVYSILLAVQTLESLQARQTGPRPRPKSKARLDFKCRVGITTVQVHWTLPKRNVVTRFDGLNGHFSSAAPPRLGFKQALLLVPLPNRVNRWQSQNPGQWDELLNLQKWDAVVVLEKPNQSVAVTGESACLRIPSGFIFSDLVFDASILAKAFRHITHITKAGRFWEFPPPEPEDPKVVPHLSFRLGYLCVEAQDDPFESELSRIWRGGPDAAKQRMEREEAFSAKVSAIRGGQQQPATFPQLDHDYQFDAAHTVSIEEARQRLNEVHVIDWIMRMARLKDLLAKGEEGHLHKLFGAHRPSFEEIEATIVPVLQKPKDHAPLLRIGFHGLNLMIGGPSFPIDELPGFLSTQGAGMPHDTQFSLLIPLHIHFTLTALKTTLRDYPVPLLHILPHTDRGDKTVFTFDTDFVIAEEMGTDMSTEWHTCTIIDAANTVDNEAPWSIAVPKTIMPVKTYANPSISVNSPSPTILGWGISYGPAIQDVMRVIETLTTPPQDPSPVMGFWDKMRLVLHWKLDLNFVDDVQVYLKGTRDPYEMTGNGAGFVLAFQGSPRIRIGYENEQRELVQITSDLMAIAVPDMDYISPINILPLVSRTLGIPRPFKKVWARLNSGVRFGVGFLPERSCGPECPRCSGHPTERTCRLFTFKPHYEVLLQRKPFVPQVKSADDSFNGFRSDFVHLSFSLESAVNKPIKKNATDRDYSSLHLTPQLFTHFWSWCMLFNGALSLPIRQGSYYPPKPVSPKLGRHLATLKYRISIPHLYAMHGYMDESRETWADGVASWIGVKAMVDELNVDMHQREEESIVPGPIPGTTRILRRKPFNAAEVVLKGLDMRALVATFPSALKKEVPMQASQYRSNYRKHPDLPLTNSSSPWHDTNDFIELDWEPQTEPLLHLMPVVRCPRLSYFKRPSTPHEQAAGEKFGREDSHVCLLDKEPSAPRVQILLASHRVGELRGLIRKASHSPPSKMAFDLQTAEKMVSLLEDYVTLLKNLDAKVDPDPSDPHSYFMPSEIISDKEWAEFENVYQMHCPSIFLDAAIRDIMMQYYYCSRARRGLEYHMATRAVKFIRDQANAAKTEDDAVDKKADKQAETANIAAAALRKILGTEKASVEISREPKVAQSLTTPDPLEGWADGVALRKSHCCLLLKPQIVLRGTDSKDTCIVTASQAKLQSYAIMDIFNSDDPVSGKIMSRNFTSLSGMQVYSPTIPLALGNSIPLEVVIDLRCESKQFERLVPQTDAAFHYDKFNRLRLRNTATLALSRASPDEPGATSANHLQDQTDLVRIHIPRFTVSANTEHFQAISNIVTKLLLFSDAAHKTRLDRLETMIFAYDFRDLASAANVISNLQARLRDAVETQQSSLRRFRGTVEDAERLSYLGIKAHVLLLQEELGLLFDAIKLAQDRFDASAEQNNALLLHASSSEISWRMLDERKNLLAKLVVQDINFHWLNRQDSSTVNHLTVGNLTAFDGSRYAMWAEIISKYDEPANHPLLKKGLFCLARWTILAPVGGITIYENFELSFHPLRLQIDAKVGHRIMEYVWPARKERQQRESSTVPGLPQTSPLRSSFDSPRGAHGTEASLPAPRRLAASRSFTDLRGVREHGFLAAPAFLQKNRSSESVVNTAAQTINTALVSNDQDTSEAAVMKTRSTQKSFVFVRIASLNLLLSIVKEGSFECHDARIKTRVLEYRNQTWSFEELVNQFIPSDMGWKGWVKMAFHQPLVPVFPVAKELLAKTRWTASKSGSQIHDSPLKMLHPKMMLTPDDDRLLQGEGASKVDTNSAGRRLQQRIKGEPSTILSPQPMNEEPGVPKEDYTGSSKRPDNRRLKKSFFSMKRTSSKPKRDSAEPTVEL